MVEKPHRQKGFRNPVNFQRVKCANCGCGGEQRYQCSSTLSLAIQGQTERRLLLTWSKDEGTSPQLYEKKNYIFPLTTDHYEHQTESGTDAHTRTINPAVYRLQQTELNMGKLEVFIYAVQVI